MSLMTEYIEREESRVMNETLEEAMRWYNKMEQDGRCVNNGEEGGEDCGEDDDSLAMAKTRKNQEV